MERKLFSSGTHWEPIVGYSRAVRVGQHIYVSGTTATDIDGLIVGIGSPHAQTMQIIKNIAHALQELGGGLEYVVRTRIYVTKISAWEEVGKAHGHFFQVIRPATSLVEVSSLISPEILVEMEADAFVP